MRWRQRPFASIPHTLGRAQFGAKPGWTLVTGNPSDIQQLLRAFISVPPGQTSAIAGQEGARHLPVIVMINEPRGLSKVDFSLSAAYWVNRSLTTWFAPVAQPTPSRTHR